MEKANPPNATASVSLSCFSMCPCLSETEGHSTMGLIRAESSPQAFLLLLEKISRLLGQDGSKASEFINLK